MVEVLWARGALLEQQQIERNRTAANQCPRSSDTNTQLNAAPPSAMNPRDPRAPSEAAPFVPSQPLSKLIASHDTIEAPSHIFSQGPELFWAFIK